MYKFKVVVLRKGHPINAWAYEVRDISKCKAWEEGVIVDFGHDDDMNVCFNKASDAFRFQINKHNELQPEQ